MGLSPSEKDTTPEPFIRAFLYCLQNVFDCILIKLIPLSIKTIILPSRENSELVDAFGGWRLAGVGRKRKRDVGQATFTCERVFHVCLRVCIRYACLAKLSQRGYETN